MSGDPKLGALADNGGLTQTFALLPGSPVIDAGSDSICMAAPVNNLDQRGVTRPIGAHCEIGAFETNLPADTTAPTASPSQFPAANSVGWNTAGTITINWNWTDEANGSEIDNSNCTISS